MAQALEAADEPPLDRPAVPLIQVVRAEVVGDGGGVVQEVPDGDQDAVSDGDRRPLLAAPGDEAVVARGQGGVLGAAGGLGSLPWCPACDGWGRDN